MQPRHDVNAPDLYIPAMAFVTYVLMTGLSLGLMERSVGCIIYNTIRLQHCLFLFVGYCLNQKEKNLVAVFIHCQILFSVN